MSGIKYLSTILFFKIFTILLFAGYISYVPYGSEVCVSYKVIKQLPQKNFSKLNTLSLKSSFINKQISVFVP